MAIEDKYEEDIDKLIDTGKEKGYLTYGEVNDLLPGDMHSPDDVDDLITTIGTQGIDLLDGGPKGGDAFDSESEDGEDVELAADPLLQSASGAACCGTAQAERVAPEPKEKASSCCA